MLTRPPTPIRDRLGTHATGIRIAPGATLETVFIELFAAGLRLVLAGVAIAVFAARTWKGRVYAAFPSHTL